VKPFSDEKPEQSGLPSMESVSAIVPMLEVFRPAAIYLFGSMVHGGTHPQSDIDLAFLPLHACDPVQVFEMASRLADLLGREVDLIDLRAASTVMAKEVLRTGKLLAQSDPSRRKDFEMRTLADYARLNEERQPVLLKLAAAHS
jgi:uncharacterized protein